MKAAVYHLDAKFLAKALQLPEEAFIYSTRVLPNRPGAIEIYVQGIGDEVPGWGGLMPVRQPSMDEGGAIDWGEKRPDAPVESIAWPKDFSLDTQGLQRMQKATGYPPSLNVGVATLHQAKEMYLLAEFTPRAMYAKNQAADKTELGAWDGLPGTSVRFFKTGAWTIEEVRKGYAVDLRAFVEEGKS